MILPITRGVGLPPCLQDATMPRLAQMAKSSLSSAVEPAGTLFLTGSTMSRFMIRRAIPGNGAVLTDRLFHPCPRPGAEWAKPDSVATNSTSWEGRTLRLFITESTFTIQHQRRGDWKRQCRLPCTAFRQWRPMAKFSSRGAVSKRDNQLQLFFRHFHVSGAR